MSSPQEYMNDEVHINESLRPMNIPMLWLGMLISRGFTDENDRLSLPQPQTLIFYLCYFSIRSFIDDFISVLLLV